MEGLLTRLVCGRIIYTVVEFIRCLIVCVVGRIGGEIGCGVSYL